METQGSPAAPHWRAATISAADAVIFATDVGVKDRQRFAASQPVVASGVKRAINEPDAMVAEVLVALSDLNSARVQGELTRPTPDRRRWGTVSGRSR